MKLKTDTTLKLWHNNGGLAKKQKQKIYDKEVSIRAKINRSDVFAN